MLRALHDQMSFGAVSRRELPVSSHLPYLRHVDDWIVKSKGGLLMNFIKLEGFSFQTADWSDINVRMLGRNDLVRTLGNSRFALYSHIIRREIEPAIPSSFDNAFCRELDERYHTALSKRRMFVNDLYLTIIRRPLQGHAGTFEALLQTVLGQKTADGDSFDQQEAQTESRDVTTAVLSAMAAYRPRHLQVVERDGVWFSEPLEFLVQLGNGAIPRPMHLPRMSLDQALATKRVFFGKNALEIRGASASETRFGAVLSVREYPAQTGPGFLDNLLTIPHEFIVTQSFAIIDRPAAQSHIDRVARQVAMSDEAESVVAEHLNDARDELLAWAGRYDARVREVTFRPDEVVAVNGSYGVSTMIVLGEDEKIETLALGDSIAWKVEPNKRGNIIFVKPIEKNAFSNLNVVTSKRIYSFVLRADFRQGKAQVFKVRFRFPDDEADATLIAIAKERARYPNAKNFNVANANSDYAYKGSSLSKPTAVFDDGVKTWFRFAPDQETPAIFVVDRDRKESVVNFRKEGPYIVVDKVNFQWTLRNGEGATCIFNRRLNNLHEPDGLEPYVLERVGSTGFQFW